MQSESTTATGTDPLKAVADALDTAVQAAKEGAEKARMTASEAMPAASQLLSRATYKACYGISFGVVFPTMLIVRALPKDNPVVHGLIDGANAAIDMVNEIRFKSQFGEGQPRSESGEPQPHWAPDSEPDLAEHVMS